MKTMTSSSVLEKLATVSIIIAVCFAIAKNNTNFTSLFTYNETETMNSLTKLDMDNNEKNEKLLSEMTEEELWNEYEKLEECTEHTECWLRMGQILLELWYRGVDIYENKSGHLIAKYLSPNNEDSIILILPIIENNQLPEFIYDEARPEDIQREYHLNKWVKREENGSLVFSGEPNNLTRFTQKK